MGEIWRNEISCSVRLEDAMFEVTEERREAKLVARKPRFDRKRRDQSPTSV